MIKLDKKRLERHRGRVRSVHRQGLCRWCNSIDETPKYRKRLGNCKRRTLYKYQSDDNDMCEM